jgi:polyisoprenyl-teichoic acid--peptidoglycan teichoic acid transferase
MLYCGPASADLTLGAMTDRPRRRRPVLAAALSFLFPGLGQAYAGQHRLAIAFALPVLLLAIGVLVGVLLVGDEALNQLFSQQFLFALLIVNLVLLLWRGLAIAHAWLAHSTEQAAAVGPARVRWSPTTLAGVAAILVLTIGMHAYVAFVVDRLNTTLAQVFSGGAVEQAVEDGRPAIEPPRPLNEPYFEWDGTERMNFLLIGVDAAPGREEVMTDTILVISIDPVAEDAVMISVPRDTGFVPLPDTEQYAQGVYPHKINELAMEAEQNAELWCPDLESDGNCGIRTLERSIGLYLGIPIHYYARVDLIGFTELIDAVGGVELCLDGDLIDPQYIRIGGGPVGIELPSGCHWYDGRDALAFARIRHGQLELPDGTIQPQNDFRRAERQQQVLLALRRELAGADLVFELPGLLSAIARTVTTDFPRDQAGDLASLLPLITGDDIEREVLGLPEYVDPPVQPEVNYLLIPRRDAIRERMIELFGPDLEGWYLATEEPLPPPPDDEPVEAMTRPIGGALSWRP